MTDRRLARVWAWLSRRDRWKVHLGAGAGTILAVGMLLAPRVPAPVVKAPEDTAVPLLREEFERRDASSVFRNVHQLGPTVGDSVVTFVAPPDVDVRVHADFVPAPASPTPIRLGDGLIVSDDGEVLTHVSAMGRRLEAGVELPSGVRTTAHVVAYEHATGLVLARLADAAPAALRLSTTPLSPGDVAAAVSRPHRDPVPAPVYVAAVGPSELTLAALSEGLAAGTPVFDLNGAPIALVGGRPRTAHRVSVALDRLRNLAASGHGLPRTLGLVLQEVTPTLRPLVSDAAVIVAALEDGGPAERAGLDVGDGLLALDDQPIADLPAAIAAIAALPLDGPSSMLVRRGRRDITLNVAALATLAAPTAEVRLPPVDPAPPAGRLFSSATLAAAGVPADAEVLEIDGRRMTERAADTYLRRRRGQHLLYLAHEGRRYFAVAEGQE